LTTCILSDSQWAEIKAVSEPLSKKCRQERIAAALGPASGLVPKVDDETLRRYYKYLSENLTFPFTVHYPEPTNSREEFQFRCTVLELLDPSEQLGDMFDGIFCATRKGMYEINLPLNELKVAHDSPNFDLIEDFRCWFWHWR
jgi:hypothetical protein